MRVAINGTDIDTAETIAGGNYSIDLAAAAGDVITVYLEDETEDAVTVTVSDGANLAGLDLYQNYLIVRHDNAGSLSNANLATGTVGGEDDISNIYSTSGGNLTVEGGNELFIWTGDTFAPGGNLTARRHRHRRRLDAGRQHRDGVRRLGRGRWVVQQLGAGYLQRIRRFDGPDR